MGESDLEDLLGLGSGGDTDGGILPASVDANAASKVLEQATVSSDDFNTRFRHRRPVKLTELARSWPAMQKWLDLDYLGGLLPADHRVTVLVAKDNCHFFKLALCDTEEMFYRDVIDHIFRPTPEQASRRIYCRLPLLPEFLADMDLPHDLTGVESGFKLANCGVWMSSSGNITPLHFDLCHGFLVQVTGEKQWSYFEPDDFRSLYPASSVDPNPLSSKVQLDRWLAGDEEERRKHPRVAEATRYETAVTGGDLIYTPPFWWHCVTTVTPSISVLLPFDMSPSEPIHSCAQL